MGFAKEDREKEFICRQCWTFLDNKDLKEGKCPNCDTDEYVFNNDLNINE